MATAAPKIWTVEEVLALPDDRRVRRRLIDGELRETERHPRDR